MEEKYSYELDEMEVKALDSRLSEGEILKIKAILDDAESFVRGALKTKGSKEFLSRLRSMIKEEEPKYYREIGNIIAASILRGREERGLGIPVYDLVLRSEAAKFVSMYVEDFLEGKLPEEIQEIAEEKQEEFSPPNIVPLEIHGVWGRMRESYSMIAPSIEYHRVLLEDGLGDGEGPEVEEYDGVFRILGNEILDANDYLSTIFF